MSQILDSHQNNTQPKIYSHSSKIGLLKEVDELYKGSTVRK